jgi:hypothetical protein
MALILCQHYLESIFIALNKTDNTDAIQHESSFTICHELQAFNDENDSIDKTSKLFINYIIVIRTCCFLCLLFICRIFKRLFFTNTFTTFYF